MIDRLTLALESGRLAALGLETSFTSVLRAVRLGPREMESPCEPIVLMHGFAGFREIGFERYPLLEYFNGVRRLLGQMGYRVFAPEVSPFNHPLERARQWMSHIERIRSQTGAERVHLVGHSQGGLDARVLVAPTRPAEETPIGPLLGLGYGPHVASVTTIATPHLGSALTDLADSDDPARREALDLLLRIVGVIAQLVQGEPQNAEDAVEALSPGFMNDYFNPIIEDDPSVPCFAIAGDPGSPELVGPLLKPFYNVILELDPSEGGGPNDGLVTVESSFFGNLPEAYAGDASSAHAEQRRHHWQILGCVCADHVAEVGIPLQFLPSDTYDHFSLFAGLAQRLDPAYVAEMTLQKDGRWRRQPKPAGAAA
jgi:triacylglycerol lipase